MIEQSKHAIQNPIGAPALGFALAVILIWILTGVAGLSFGHEVGAAITTVVTYVTQRVVRRLES